MGMVSQIFQIKACPFQFDTALKPFARSLGRMTSLQILCDFIYLL